MHLLSFDNAGVLRLSEFFNNQVPPYAILSHTWGPDADELTYKDVKKGRGKDKEGFKKIKFCMQQAAKDGLEYCWIDTCCIDKPNLTELTEAINSMFRWYRNAATCYVYLVDVPNRPFKDSRWFTRGWTLQELIAPTQLDFYSATGVHLGSRETLLDDLHEITGVPLRALQGQQPLSQFSMEERLSWMYKRRTKREEDLAYSLLGILGVPMPLIYGEGRQNAMIRLRAQFRETHAKQDQQPLPTQYTNWKNFSLPLAFPNKVQRPHAFVGRQAELRELRDTLRSSTNLGPVVLHGLSGMGKTMLAHEFATRYHADFSVVFWINGDDENTFQQDLWTAARRVPQLEPVFAKGSDFNSRSGGAHEHLDAMTDWLGQEGNNRWLVIIDNVQEAALYDWSSYIPTNQGRVLLISQSTLSRRSNHFLLSKIEGKDDSLELLLRHSHRPAIATEPGTNDLIECLDGLPLALSLAGTFLRKVAASPAEYLEQYHNSWSEFQKMSPTLPEHEERRLHTTWDQSYKKVQQQDNNAGKLLQVLACFGDSEVDFDLLSAGLDDSDPQWYQSVMQTKFTFGRCVSVLCEHDLVRRSDVSYGYRMHPCVRAWLRAVWVQDYHPLLVLRSIANNLPPSFPDEPIQWHVVQRILPHVRQWITWLPLQQWPEEAAEHLTKLGTLCVEFSFYYDAETLLKKALQIKESLPSIHLSGIVEIMVNLGLVYIGLSRYEDAEEKIQKALNTHLSDIQPNLARGIRVRTAYTGLLLTQDRLDKAKESCLRLLKESEISFGSGHLLTLNIVRVLTGIYSASGDFDESRAQGERVAKGLELLLGEDHPQVLSIARRVGHIICLQERAGEAEKLIHRAVKGHMDAFGPRHVMTLESQRALATVYYEAEEYVEAQQLLECVITRFSEVLGSQSRDTLRAKIDLGRVLYTSGEKQQAADVYQECIIISTKLLGPDHGETLDATYNLGMAQSSLGDVKGAETNFRVALEGCAVLRGPEHTQTLDALECLVSIYQKLGDRDKAEDCLLRLIAGQTIALGVNNAQTLSAKLQLAVMYSEEAKYKAAKVLLRDILSAQDYNADSVDNGLRMDAVEGLGKAHAGLNEWDSAEDVLLTLLSHKRRTYGSEHTRTTGTMLELGNCYRHQQRYGEAEMMLTRAVTYRGKALGPEAPGTLGASLVLAVLYETKGVLGDASKAKQARLLYERVYKSLETLGSASEEILYPAKYLASFCERQGETQRAREVWRYIADGCKELYGSNHREYRDAAEHLKAMEAVEDTPPQPASSPKHRRFWRKKK